MTGRSAGLLERRDVAAGGVRFAVHRADPPRRRRTTPALLLHGVPQTADIWRHLAAELARDRIVLAPDLKGLGRSELREPYDVPTLVSELAALVLHEVDGPVDVVGHDWGGSLAIALAAQRPELVRRLVVANAPYRRVDLRRAWHIPLFALPVLPEVAFALGGRRLLGAMLGAGWRAATPPDEGYVERYREAYADLARVSAMLAYYRGVTRPQAARALLAALGRRPAARPAEPSPEQALVLWGGRDPVLPVELGRGVAADLAADLVVLDDAGHFVVEEAADEFTGHVTRFLRAATP